MEMKLHRRDIELAQEKATTEESEDAGRVPRCAPSDLLVRLLERNPTTRAPRLQSTMFNMEGR